MNKRKCFINWIDGRRVLFRWNEKGFCIGCQSKHLCNKGLTFFKYCGLRFMPVKGEIEKLLKTYE